MKSRVLKCASRAPALPEAALVDALYGLEPVFEPGADADSGPCAADTPWRSVQCPWCGEVFQTPIDPSAGSTSYTEDCQICCQPIEFNLSVDDGDRSVTLSTRRES